MLVLSHEREGIPALGRDTAAIRTPTVMRIHAQRQCQDLKSLPQANEDNFLIFFRFDTSLLVSRILCTGNSAMGFGHFFGLSPGKASRGGGTLSAYRTDIAIICKSNQKGFGLGT